MSRVRILAGGALIALFLTAETASIAQSRPPFRSYDNYDLTGPELLSLKEENEHDCLTACEANSHCRAYSFNKWEKQCSLRNDAGSSRFEPSSKAGLPADTPPPPEASAPWIVRGFEGRLFSGHSYRADKLPSYENCERTCENDQNCAALSYSKVQKTCKLFDTVEGYSSDADTSSAIKQQVVGWIGLQIQPVSGALVAESIPGGPALEAGILTGDVITAVNGTPIADAYALAQKIAATLPGTEVRLSILRNGQPKTVDVKLVAMPRQEEKKTETEQREKSADLELGLSLAPASEVGVAVIDIAPGSPAADHGMKAGDVILDVSGRRVENPSDVREAVDQARSQGKHAILMRVKAAEGTKFVAIPIAR